MVNFQCFFQTSTINADLSSTQMFDPWLIPVGISFRFFSPSERDRGQVSSTLVSLEPIGTCSRTLNRHRVLAHVLPVTLEGPRCRSAANPDHRLMAFLHSWTPKLPSWPRYSTVNVLAIHSNIEHRKFDADKSGSVPRKSIASVWLVENEWNTSVKIRSPILSASTCVTNDQHYSCG